MKQNIVKYFFEFLIVFLGVYISFTVQQQTDENKEKEEINKSITTLRQEIQSNLRYCKEHLVQLENMEIVNSKILLNFETFQKSDLIEWHNSSPFGHSYLNNGELRYWTDESDYENIYFWLITWWNTFSQNEVYFNSLVSSGLLLYIENNELREEIESIYQTKKKRVLVNEALLKDVSDKIFMWQEKQRDKYKKSVSREHVMTYDRNSELHNLLKDRKFRIELRIMSLKNYIEALEMVSRKLQS
jgi:hypothetical protein